MNQTPNIFDADPNFQTLVQLSSESTEIFARTFMKRQFRRDMSPQHKRLCTFLDRRGKMRRKKNGKSGRGFGKTSLILMAKAAQAILYDHARFVVYITNSEKRAIARTENLKRELLRNEIIRKVWPSIRISEDEIHGMNEEFSKNAWVAFGRTVVVPMGFNQTPRGLLFGEFRPDLILVDDWMSVKRLHNEDFRTEDFEMFRGDIEEAVDQYDDDWEIVHLDTVKHQDALTERLEDLPDWETISLPMAEFRDDGLLYSTMPDLVSDEKIRESYASHEALGSLDVFFREKMCKAHAKGSEAVLKEHIKHVSETDYNLLQNLREMDSIVIVDPANSDDVKACETGIVGWTVDRYKPALYCRRARGLHLMPEAQADAAIDMALDIGAHIIGIEVTGKGQYAVYPLKNRISQRGLNMSVVELHATGGKTDRGKTTRINSIIPFYRRGEVYHVEGECFRLEQQLLSLPSPKLRDVLDAAAYIVEILAKGDAFWMPPEIDQVDMFRQAAKEWEALKTQMAKDDAPLSWGCC